MSSRRPAFEIRELGEADLEAARQLTQLAFGSMGSKPAELAWTRYGAFTPAGDLLGTAADRHHHHWWGGQRVKAADVSHVAVLPEARGGGIARALMGALVEGARDRGASVSNLFTTTAAVYRSTGWGTIGARHLIEFPTAMLPAHRRDGELSVRTGTVADRSAAGDLYTAAARERNGMQCREDAPWGPTGFHGDEVHGLTVVEDAEGMVGFASWNRGPGHGDDAVLTVVDMIATSTAATRELLAILASWRNVAPTVRFRALLSGVVANELPLEKASRHRIDPLMHRLVEVERAVADRGWPAAMNGAAGFDLVDDLAPWNSGSWAVEITAGRGHAERTGGGSGLRLTAQGLALLVTGVMSPTMLVEAGQLTVDPGVDPATLAVLMPGGPKPESLDQF